MTDQPTPDVEPATQPEEVAEPVEQQPEAEAPATPWANDLEQRFTDEQQRAAVDEFLRENIQPYITQLEQASATDRNAKRLWDDFQQNPLDTYAAVTSEIFGEDVAEQVTRVLESENEWDTDESDNDEGEDLEDELDENELAPEVKETVEYVQQQRQEEAYQAELERIQEEHPDVEFDEQLFIPFVVASEGDWDAAAASYTDYVAKAKEKFGIQVPDPEEVNPPPPTVGPDSRAPSSPPVETSPETLDEAIDELFDDMNRNANPPPSTVGST